MDKKELASFLEEIATLLELQGENPFKCNAYRAAAQTIETLDRNLEGFQTVEDFARLKGIGKSLAEKILVILQTGTLPLYQELKQRIPSGLVEMLRIAGMGPKRVRTVYEKLGIISLGELEYACRENRLLELPGFGVKIQENTLKGIEYLKKAQGRFHLHKALAAAHRLQEDLAKLPQVDRIETAGSIRRFKETVKDIDLLITTAKPATVMNAFTSHPLVESIIAHGETKSSVRLTMGINVDLRVVTKKEFPFALLYFTGSREHNIVLRGRAQKQGYKLNEYGLFKRQSTKSLDLKSEEEIYKALGLSYIPPELREDQGEIQAAEQGSLPQLVTLKDLRGSFHIHTTSSDGAATIKEFAAYAQKQGLEYLGISDHSRSAFYANGLSTEKILKQHREIDALNKSLKGFHIFKGIESDILPDGSLDYPEDILALFDFVIISVHSKFKMTEEEMTKRIIKAMENPHTTMLGHPTGRLLLAREAYEVDMEAIIQAAAQHGIIIELNANPFRLDLDWRYIKKALDKGVLISINPDAHSLNDMKFVELGVGLARKGWCEPRHVLNSYSATEVKKIFSKIHKS